MRKTVLLFYLVLTTDACASKEDETYPKREITFTTSSENKDTAGVYVKFIIGNKKNIIVKLYEKHVSEIRTIILSLIKNKVRFILGEVQPETTLEIRHNNETQIKEFYPYDVMAVNYYSNLRGTLFFKQLDKKESKLDMSRFFFNLSDNRFNDGTTTVFGKVVKGLNEIDDLVKIKSYKNKTNITKVKGRFENLSQ